MCTIELIVTSCVCGSCVCGYHVYGENWIAALGEELYCERNVIDQYAVAMKDLLQQWHAMV